VHDPLQHVWPSAQGNAAQLPQNLPSGPPFLRSTQIGIGFPSPQAQVVGRSDGQSQVGWMPWHSPPGAEDASPGAAFRGKI
jgi:hypothetical protein